MLPKTDASAVPCSNISSNCVIWQGPDIPCIELCTGDTVSDVVAALAQQLCDLVIPEPDADGLDLLCVLPQGQAQPTELKDVVQLIIDYVCDQESEPDFELPTLELPACLSPYEDPNGNLFTALPLDEYAELLGNKICDILQTIDVIQVTLSSHNDRITILEGCVLDANGDCNTGGGDVSVFSSCILENQTVAASVLLLALEERFCDLETAVGAPPLIGNAVNQAACITSSEPMLGSAGTYGGVPGWVSTPTTLAHAVGNAWIVICDMHQAIQDIQLNCCPGACDSIVFDFESEITVNGQGNPTGISLTFQNSVIPAGWNDCGGSTTISVTDNNGVLAQDTFSFVNYAGTSTPYLFNLQNTSLSTVGTITTSIDFCITDGQDQCDATVVSTTEGQLQCPENVQVINITEETAEITFVHQLGTSAIYTFVITDTDTNTQISTFTQSNLPVNATIPLTGLAEDTNYSVSISVQLNGVSQTCNPAIFQTEAGGISPGGAINTSGDEGEYLIPLTVGTGPGTLEVTFNSSNIPDRFQIWASPTSNDFALMGIVADSLYVGDDMFNDPNDPINGTYPNLNQYTYVGDGTGNATGQNQPGNDWNITGQGTVTLQITDGSVCNNTSTKGLNFPTNGQARNGAPFFQIGVTPTPQGRHCDGNVTLRFVKGQTTSSIVYIRVESADQNTGWAINNSTFTP